MMNGAKENTLRCTFCTPFISSSLANDTGSICFHLICQWMRVRVKVTTCSGSNGDCFCFGCCACYLSSLMMAACLCDGERKEEKNVNEQAGKMHNVALSESVRERAVETRETEWIKRQLTLRLT